MMAQQQSLHSPARRLHWRKFLQFSLRTLLALTTVAAVGCWWFLQPQRREERLGQTPLVLRREIRLVKVKVDSTGLQIQRARMETINGQLVGVMNAGKWRISLSGRDLLVDGQYANGKEQGKWTIYHVNGRKAVEGMMVQGEKVGRWRTWDEEGRLLSDVTQVAVDRSAP